MPGFIGTQDLDRPAIGRAQYYASTQRESIYRPRRFKVARLCPSCGDAFVAFGNVVCLFCDTEYSHVRLEA